MLSTRGRTVVTTVVVLEAGIAGWALGHGLLWLAAMLAAVTVADCTFGIVRRHSFSDITGLELGALLAVLLVRPAGTSLVVAMAATCAAWLVRPERYERRTPARP